MKLIKPNLYKEFLKQSITLEGIILVLCTFMSFMSVSTNVFLSAYDISDGRNIPVFFASLNTGSFLMILANGIILTAYMFRYLTKVSMSDVYFSVPSDRKALFGSTFLATQTTAFVGLVINIIISIVMVKLHKMPGNSFVPVIEQSSLIWGIVFLMVVQFMLSALMSLAMSVSGGYLGAGILFISVIGTIEVFITYMAIALNAAGSAFFKNIFSSIFNSVNAPITHIILNMSVSSYYDWFAVDHSYCSLVWFLLLGIVFLICAYIAFQKRPVHISGNKISGYTGSKVIAITLCTAISTFATVNLLCGKFDNWRGISNLIFYLLYVVAILTFVLILLSLDKNGGKLKKAAPLIAIPLVLQIAFFAFGYGICAQARDYKVDVDNTDSISLSYCTAENTPDEYYNEKFTREVVITDRETIEFFSKAFNDVKELQRYNRGKYDLIYCDSVNAVYNWKMYVGGKTLTVKLTEEENKKALSLLGKNKEFTEAFTKIPNLEDENIINFIAVVRTNPKELGYSSAHNQIKTENIYEYICNSLKDCTLEEFFEATHGNVDILKPNGYIEFYIYEDMSLQRIGFSFSTENMSEEQMNSFIKK